MARAHDFLVDSVSAFLAQSTCADTGVSSRTVPNSVPHLLSHLLLAVEDYIEGEPETVPILRQACQRIVTDLAHALRGAQWSPVEVITLVTKFVDWSMRHAVCQSTDAIVDWIVKQAPLWIMTVYNATSHHQSDPHVNSSGLKQSGVSATVHCDYM